ncbi:MAG: translation elongation factor [Chloroflexi bacterium]|nr:MAG: translation elongation factor [Chloroflexota bacterium]
MSKNDAAWTELFERHDILNKIQRSEYFRISSSQINALREARLMAKFDHSVNLPNIFRAHNLTILPDSRGAYLIGHFDAYQTIRADFPVNPIEISFPPVIESIDYTNLYSEASALLCAYNCGIIDDVVGEPVNLTVLGRMSTSRFAYRIRNTQVDSWYNINVENAQCEIDGGFEGSTKFAIVEAKTYIADDFLIRQLYYPYRLWQSKIKKWILPIFMSYSNDVFNFLIYEFKDVENYNSLELIEQRSYKIASESIELEDIFEVFQQVQILPEPIGVPFPQADNFRRVIDLLGLLYHSDLTAQSITLEYQFDQRQTQYYTRSAMYLGLVNRLTDTSPVYTLSELGKSILQMPAKQKYLAIVRQILQHEVFYKVTELYFKNSVRPSREAVVTIMQNASLNISGTTTIPRRAQTVLAWVDWILSLPRAINH